MKAIKRSIQRVLLAFTGVRTNPRVAPVRDHEGMTVYTELYATSAERLWHHRKIISETVLADCNVRPEIYRMWRTPHGSYSTEFQKGSRLAWTTIAVELRRT